MKIDEFYRLLNNNILILDGASGTEMQKRGMPTGVCPELWAAGHPELLIDLQREYFKAGSNAVYTFTMGANRKKLEHYDRHADVRELNRRLAQVSREAAGEKGLVAGDISSTGHFISPVGDLAFEEAVEIYKEQVRGLLLGGVDFFVIETMIDIQETRAALIAVKESSDLPVCVCMTFGEDGRTVTGTDPMTAVVTLQCLGAAAVGCNCSAGPEQMLGIITEMKKASRVPLIAKPNAGIPQLINGETVFGVEPDTFGALMLPFARLGVSLVGGCCGTTPEHIRKVKEYIDKAEREETYAIGYCSDENREKGSDIWGVLTSASRTLLLHPEQRLTVIGERINPTGKKALQRELLEGELNEIHRLAHEQVNAGAEILDVNVGMPGISELDTMVKTVEYLSTSLTIPLCIDSSDPEVIEAALRVYPGRALINSIPAETGKMEKLLPIAAKYGAMFILLPLNEKGIPSKAEERYWLIQDGVKKAGDYGFSKRDIIADALAMTASADQKAPAETLKVIEWCRNECGILSVIGLSNISFGLPERNNINAAFLAMAADRGLSLVIANPSAESMMNMRYASDVLTGRDAGSTEYIKKFAAAKPSAEQINEKPSGTKKADYVKDIFDAVAEGNLDSIEGLLDKALKEGAKPQRLVDECLIPAINHVGELFDKQIYYLPQLIRSANTMKTAFTKLEPLLEQDAPMFHGKKVKIVLATVKGDIHDIGKNIVSLMFRNYGFEVYDAGRDAKAEDIVKKAKEVGASIIGLSALMTTTMTEMKNVIELVRSEGLQCKIMIGGAAVTQAYADEIGADGYSADANSAVKLAQRLS